MCIDLLPEDWLLLMTKFLLVAFNRKSCISSVDALVMFWILNTFQEPFFINIFLLRLLFYFQSSVIIFVSHKRKEHFGLEEMFSVTHWRTDSGQKAGHWDTSGSWLLMKFLPLFSITVLLCLCSAGLLYFILDESLLQCLSSSILSPNTSIETLSQIPLVNSF